VPSDRLFIQRFLNRPRFNGGAYVLIRVRDTTGQRDHYVQSEIEFEIGDCSRRVVLDFSLDSAPDRANSLRKARVLADAMQRFVHALEAEAPLAAARERDWKRKAKAANSTDDAGQDWMVHVHASGGIGSLFDGPGSEALLDAMIELMSPYSGSVGGTMGPDPTVSVTLTIRSRCAEDAPRIGGEVVRSALRRIGVDPDQVAVELEASP
jgi:hypothetical protein